MTLQQTHYALCGDDPAVRKFASHADVLAYVRSYRAANAQGKA